MARLQDRLYDEIGNWFERLPASWQEHFEDVTLDFDAVDEDAELDDDERIWPLETNAGGPDGCHLFKAFYDLATSEIRVIIFGNDPYTKLNQATGRSFEQGNLGNWNHDLPIPGRVSPSLKSLICAAVGTNPASAGYQLTDTRQMIEPDKVKGRRQPTWFSHVELARALSDGAVKPPSPSAIFNHWAKQGVLWLNRTLTYSKWDEEHRASHQALWAPFTDQAIRTIVGEAENRPLIFVMWGSSADDLEPEIAALGRQLGVPGKNIRAAVTGHPQWPEGYFRVGNPLTQINHLIGGDGPSIAWT